METEENVTEQTAPSHHPNEIVRPLEGRVIAGVAKGIANRFGWPDWLIRVGFVLTAFAGGLGIALYVAGWAFLRSEEETDTPADRFFRTERSVQGWVGVGLVVLAGLIVLGNFSFISGEVLFALALFAIGVLLYTGRIPAPSGTSPDSPPENPRHYGAQPMTTTQLIDTEQTDAPAGDVPTGGTPPPPPPPLPTPTPPVLPPTKPRESSILGRLTFGVMLLALGVLALLDNIDSLPIYAEPRHYMALAVTILGLGLLVGAFAGRARWLIVVGVVLIPTLLFSPVFEYDWNSDTFDRFVAPATFEDLEGSYTFDVGNMVIDLSQLDWNGETIELDATGDIGNLEVRIPDDVAVTGIATVDIGRVSGPEGQSAGMGSPTIEFDESGSSGAVHLDLGLSIGNIEVHNR